MKVSLIIATFNNPAFLELVLESALRQNYPLHEIIVCEDGQFSKNKELIESFTKRSHAPVIHIHHADQGNRKPLCVNKGILASSGEYLVFVDGDCVLRCDFISDHVKLASTDSFLTGRRVELSQKATLLIDAGKIRSGYLDSFPWKLYLDALTGKTEHLGRFFKTPTILRSLLRRDKILDIRGCNFSVHRKHMVAINGYSNDFSGAYGEDSDVEYRLKFLGLQMKGCKGAAIQFHLWHSSQSKDPQNQELLRRILELKQAYAPNGLKESSTLL